LNKLRQFTHNVFTLDEAFAFIELDDPASAKKVARLLAKVIGLLAQNPLVGRPSASKGAREWSMPGLPYVIPYRVKGQTVQIIRIYHTSRSRPPTW
jgi:toxin ParE1/3/4